MNFKLKILLAIAYLYIFGVLLNYENAWMHRETAVTTQQLLTEHTSLPKRMAQGFNWQLFEGEYGGIPNSRARIFSNILETANILLRNGLFHFIPPHPSLSLTWIIVLILSPYYLYRLIKNLTDDDRIALITAFLYIISPGALISIIMLFHPGKAVANFFYIFCLYRSSEIIKKTEKPGARSFRQQFIFLVLTIMAALFFDEYSLYLFVLIPLFFPRLFLQKGQRRFTAILYAFIPVIYYVMLIFILPKLYTLTGYPGFNFFSRIEINRHLPTLNVWAMTVNFFLLLHDNLLAGFNAYLKDPRVSVQVTQFFSVTNHLVHDDNIKIGLSLLNDKYFTPFQTFHNVALLALLFCGAWALFQGYRAKEQRVILTCFIKSAVALIGFVIFFSLLHTTNNILAGCGYYGSCFSVLFAITLGLGLKFVFGANRWGNLLVYVFLVSLMINSFYNIRMLNYSWLALHYRESYWELAMWLNQYPRREIYEKHFLQQNSPNPMFVHDTRDNYEIIYSAWKNRKNPGTVQMLLLNAPPEIKDFLIAELPHIK